MISVLILALAQALQTVNYRELGDSETPFLVFHGQDVYILNPHIKGLNSFLESLYNTIYFGDRKALRKMIDRKFLVWISVPGRRYLKEWGIKEEWLRIYFNNLDELLSKDEKWVDIESIPWGEPAIDSMFRYIKKEVLLATIAGLKIIRIHIPSIKDQEVYDLVANNPRKFLSFLREHEIDLEKWEPALLFKDRWMRNYFREVRLSSSFFPTREIVPLSVNKRADLELLVGLNFFPPYADISLYWEDWGGEVGWKLREAFLGFPGKD